MARTSTTYNAIKQAVIIDYVEQADAALSKLIDFANLTADRRAAYYPMLEVELGCAVRGKLENLLALLRAEVA